MIQPTGSSKLSSLMGTVLASAWTLSLFGVVLSASDVYQMDQVNNMQPSYQQFFDTSPTNDLLSSNSLATSSALAVRGGGTSDEYSTGWGIGWLLRNPFGGSSKSTAQIYRSSLEEQVQLLERQLQQARNEVVSLKQKARESKIQRDQNLRTKNQQNREKSRQESAEAMEELKLERQRHNAQRQELARLQREISQLESMKAELEHLLDVSTAKIASLEEKLETEAELTQQAQQRYVAQIERLQRELDEKQQSQLERLEALYEKKVQDAVNAALEEQEKVLQAQMAELTQDMQQRHLREMEAERRRSETAIDAERQKMRKLVRALALREKKLMARSRKLGAKLDDDSGVDEDTSRVSVSISGPPTGSKRQRPIPISTNRGPI